MKRMMGVVGIVVAMAVVCQGASFRPLPEQSKADWQATHVATITYADLAAATTNTFVLTNTTTAAKQGFELVGMVLVTAFVDNATNAHNSTLITVGDGDDADLYLTSTELNSNGTEVYLKFPRNERTLTTTAATRTNVTALTLTTNSHVASIALTTNTHVVSVTPLYITLTNMVWDGGATTGTVLVATNFTVTTADGIATVVPTAADGIATVVPTTAAQASLTAASDAGSSFGQKLYTADGAVFATFTGTLPYPLADLDAGEVRLYFRVRDAAVANP